MDAMGVSVLIIGYMSETSYKDWGILFNEGRIVLCVIRIPCLNLCVLRDSLNTLSMVGRHGSSHVAMDKRNTSNVTKYICGIINT